MLSLLNAFISLWITLTASVDRFYRYLMILVVFNTICLFLSNLFYIYMPVILQPMNMSVVISNI